MQTMTRHANHPTIPAKHYYTLIEALDRFADDAASGLKWGDYTQQEYDAILADIDAARLSIRSLATIEPHDN